MLKVTDRDVIVCQSPNHVADIGSISQCCVEVVTFDADNRCSNNAATDVSTCVQWKRTIFMMNRLPLWLDWNTDLLSDDCTAAEQLVANFIRHCSHCRRSFGNSHKAHVIGYATYGAVKWNLLWLIGKHQQEYYVRVSVIIPNGFAMYEFAIIEERSSNFVICCTHEVLHTDNLTYTEGQRSRLQGQHINSKWMEWRISTVKTL